MLIRIKVLEVLPVGISEVKAHLRLDHAHEDEYLHPLIQASASFVEEYLGRSLLTQVWRLIWEKQKAYPPLISTEEMDVCSVPLPYPPLRSILSVNRLMPTGEKQPIRRHRLELNHQVPRLVFADVSEPVEIEYESGYGDRPNDIPSVLRQAILICIADFYEHRSSLQNPASLVHNSLVREILDTYRTLRLP
ncbi:MAG: hypothetical protein FJX71_00480 [Alphaproteobacteria bacterium]|nr:hypothetical protein [Alphaproteobacteria bacterium]